jgi:hypothetical protein
VEPKARITVARQSPQDIGYRQVFVSLDGKDLALLRHGEAATCEVEPGRHLLRVHNTLIRKKVELDLRPGEHARFTAVNRAGWGTYSLGALLGVGPIYLSFEREPEPRAR